MQDGQVRTLLSSQGSARLPYYLSLSVFSVFPPLSAFSRRFPDLTFWHKISLLSFFFFIWLFVGALLILSSMNIGRYYHASATLPGDIVWVLGGWSGGAPVNDVWRTLDGGLSWTVITSNAGWKGNVIFIFE